MISLHSEDDDCYDADEDANLEDYMSDSFSAELCDPFSQPHLLETPLIVCGSDDAVASMTEESELPRGIHDEYDHLDAGSAIASNGQTGDGSCQLIGRQEAEALNLKANNGEHRTLRKLSTQSSETEIVELDDARSYTYSIESSTVSADQHVETTENPNKELAERLLCEDCSEFITGGEANHTLNHVQNLSAFENEQSFRAQHGTQIISKEINDGFIKSARRAVRTISNQQLTIENNVWETFDDKRQTISEQKFLAPEDNKENCGKAECVSFSSSLSNRTLPSRAQQIKPGGAGVVQSLVKLRSKSTSASDLYSNNSFMGETLDSNLNDLKTNVLNASLTVDEVQSQASLEAVWSYLRRLTADYVYGLWYILWLLLVVGAVFVAVCSWPDYDGRDVIGLQSRINEYSSYCN
ncbi:hypothetical protein V1512DRAFT_254624 [Lipomyces arxii]|uniref:uncharacterized protein n=1 Tax=Lipomyces arxii TaxID=56418 RepID=UPI0034CE174D